MDERCFLLTDPDRTVPLDREVPSDPIDAVLRLLARAETEMEHLQLLLRDSLVELATSDEGRPLVVASSDGVRCVIIATGAPHRERARSPSWRRVDLEELVARLPEGCDVLVNPDGPAPVRLTGHVIRDAVMLTDDEIGELGADFPAVLPRARQAS